MSFYICSFGVVNCRQCRPFEVEGELDDDLEQRLAEAFEEADQRNDCSDHHLHLALGAMLKVLPGRRVTVVDKKSIAWTLGSSRRRDRVAKRSLRIIEEHNARVDANAAENILESARLDREAEEVIAACKHRDHDHPEVVVESATPLLSEMLA